MAAGVRIKRQIEGRWNDQSEASLHDNHNVYIVKRYMFTLCL